MSHHNSELYALRMLLTVVSGATSFEDLATVDGELHSTFRAACFAKGLMADDAELAAAFQEIVDVTVSLPQIRMHFARMLVHSAPQDPQALFNTFVDDLCGADEEPEAALHAIEVHMHEMGRSLTDDDFGFILPELPASQHQRKRRRGNSTHITVAESIRQRDTLLHLFTPEQHDALHQVVAAIDAQAHPANPDEPQGSNIFALTASAGCGKTVFANGLAAFLRAQGRDVCCVAASALAAMLLNGGTTAHSAFHLPIPCHETSSCNLSAADRWAIERLSLIIYDECSMVHADVGNTVERTLRDIMHDQRPFGGKVVLWMGDFKQLPPVVRYGKGHNFTLQTCQWWSLVRHLTFTCNWRAINNPVYTAFLEQVGNGHVDYVTVPAGCKAVDYADLIDKVYGTHFDPDHQILALTLETCDEINRMCFARIPGDLTECPAADVFLDCHDRDAFPSDYIASLSMKGAPPWMLQLKLGAKYMCIRNLDQTRGIINGTMLRLIAIGRRYVQVQVMTGKSKGSCELFMKSVFTITPEASGLPFTMTRTQYPMIPAYCLSVHKAQGQSLHTVGLVFESDPFTHGQLYVALSRVGSWERVFAYHQGDDIRNVVLKHLIHRRTA